MLVASFALLQFTTGILGNFQVKNKLMDVFFFLPFLMPVTFLGAAVVAIHFTMPWKLIVILELHREHVSFTICLTWLIESFLQIHFIKMYFCESVIKNVIYQMMIY